MYTVVQLRRGTGLYLILVVYGRLLIQMYLYTSVDLVLPGHIVTSEQLFH